MRRAAAKVPLFERSPLSRVDAWLRRHALAAAIAYATYRKQECSAHEIALCVLMTLVGGIFPATVVLFIQAMRSELADRADGLTAQQLLDPES